MLMGEDVASFQYKQAAVRMFHLTIIIIIIVTIFCKINNSRINQTLSRNRGVTRLGYALLDNIQSSTWFHCSNRCGLQLIIQHG